MADVFTVLAEDHQQVLAALDTLLSGNVLSPTKDEMIEKLVIDESRHEAVEELHFWPTVRSHVEDGDALADRALEQEQAAKQVLESLEKASGAERDRILASFAHAAREHIAYEQDQVWTKLRPTLSARQAEDLGATLEQAKRSAPTRPHSHTPPSPGVLRSAGPVAAAVDKVRDAITGRG